MIVFYQNNDSASPFSQFFWLQHILEKVMMFPWHLIKSEYRVQSRTNRHVVELEFLLYWLLPDYFLVQFHHLISISILPFDSFLLLIWTTRFLLPKNLTSFIGLDLNSTHMQQYMQAPRLCWYISHTHTHIYIYIYLYIYIYITHTHTEIYIQIYITRNIFNYYFIVKNIVCKQTTYDSHMDKQRQDNKQVLYTTALCWYGI